MEYDYLKRLKQSHPSLKLVAADHFPFIAGFLYRTFIKSGQRSLPYSDVEMALNNYLYHLRQVEVEGEQRYPKTAREYLDDWAGGTNAFLREYYAESDESQLDLTPEVEKVFQWIQSLDERQFVGTESRLVTVFGLLRDIVGRTEQDPRARLEELEKQRAEIEAEIERIKREGIGPYDPTQVKERFLQAEETARMLLSDFRQVEYNFRALDRETRERIAISDKPKGELLDEIFEKHDVIWGSDQGKSFRTFWEFLMLPESQAELKELLDRVYTLEEVQELSPDRFLPRLKFNLLDAGEKVYKTNNMLVEQLRKYLDTQAYLENRRIMELIKAIEKRAIEIKNQPPDARDFSEMEALKPDLNLVMSRTLSDTRKRTAINSGALTEGVAEIELSALWRRPDVDEKDLEENIRRALQDRSQISLSELTRDFPVKKGIAEVVIYIYLAGRSKKAMVDSSETEVVQWVSEDGSTRSWEVPRIVFVR